MDEPRRRAGRRHLEDVGAQIRQGDLGAAAAKGAAAKRDLDAVAKAGAARTDETLDAIRPDTVSPGSANQIGAQMLIANPAPDIDRVPTTSTSRSTT